MEKLQQKKKGVEKNREQAKEEKILTNIINYDYIIK